MFSLLSFFFFNIVSRASSILKVFILYKMCDIYFVCNVIISKVFIITKCILACDPVVYQKNIRKVSRVPYRFRSILTTLLRYINIRKFVYISYNNIIILYNLNNDKR